MILGIEAWIFWLIIAGVFVVVEIGTFNLVSIWFAGGAAAALAASLLGAPVYAQIITACAVSAALLVLILTFKPFDKLKKRLNVPTNSDRTLGEIALVTSDIENINAVGTVKVLGQVWSAVSADGTDIAAGEKVRVRSISGVKLIVERIDTAKENDDVLV